MEELLVIAAVVGLIWLGVYLFRGSLLHGCLAFLVVGFCLGHEFLQFDLGSLPLTLDRLVLGGLLAAFVVQRRAGSVQRKPVAWFEWALLGFALVLVLSTFTHDWQQNAPRKVSPIWRLVAGFLMPIMLYWIARQSRITESGLRTVYAALGLLGVFLAGTALAEISQQWWLVFPPHIADPKRGIHFGRARGPTLNAQSLGLYLDVCLLSFCLWIWKLPRPGRVLGLLTIPAWLAAIYFTYTRCVWLGLALGVLVLVGLGLRGPRRVAALGLMVSAGLLVVMLKWNDLVSIQREAGAAAARSSVDQRSSFTYVSWKMFLDHPWWGVGYSQFNQAAKPYLSDRDTPLELELIREQPNHDTFLALLTETGLIGLGLYLLVLAGWARSAWQLWRDGGLPAWVRIQGLAMLSVMGMVASPALFFDLTYSPHDHWLLFFLAGITVGLRQALPGGPLTSAPSACPQELFVAAPPPSVFGNARVD